MQKRREKSAMGRLKSRLWKKDGLPCSICKQALARVQSIQYVKVCHRIVSVCKCACVRAWDGIDAHTSMLVHIFSSWQLVYHLVMLIPPPKKNCNIKYVTQPDLHEGPHKAMALQSASVTVSSPAPIRVLATGSAIEPTRADKDTSSTSSSSLSCSCF